MTTSSTMISTVRRLLGPRPSSPGRSSLKTEDCQTFGSRDAAARQPDSTPALPTAAMTLASHKPYWIVASGDVASVGTRVVTDLAPDSVGVIIGCGDESAFVAKVRLTAGPAAGDIRICTPGEMLRKA